MLKHEIIKRQQELGFASKGIHNATDLSMVKINERLRELSGIELVAGDLFVHWNFCRTHFLLGCLSRPGAEVIMWIKAEVELKGDTFSLGKIVLSDAEVLADDPWWHYLLAKAVRVITDRGFRK